MRLARVHRPQARPHEVLVAINLLLHRVAFELRRQRLAHRIHQLLQPLEEHRGGARSRRELGQQRVGYHLHVVVVAEAGDERGDVSGGASRNRFAGVGQRVRGEARVEKGVATLERGFSKLQTVVHGVLERAEVHDANARFVDDGLFENRG